MTTWPVHIWEWPQWHLAGLIVGTLVLGAYQYGRTRNVSRDVIHSAIAIALSVALLSVVGFW